MEGVVHTMAGAFPSRKYPISMRRFAKSGTKGHSCISEGALWKIGLLNSMATVMHICNQHTRLHNAGSLPSIKRPSMRVYTFLPHRGG